MMKKVVDMKVMLGCIPRKSVALHRESLDRAVEDLLDWAIERRVISALSRRSVFKPLRSCSSRLHVASSLNSLSVIIPIELLTT